MSHPHRLVPRSEFPHMVQRSTPTIRATPVHVRARHSREVLAIPSRPVGARSVFVDSRRIFSNANFVASDRSLCLRPVAFRTSRNQPRLCLGCPWPNPKHAHIRHGFLGAIGRRPTSRRVGRRPALYPTRTFATDVPIARYRLFDNR